MIHVIASIRVKEGSLHEYVALFKQNVPNVLAEDGCVQYAPCVDPLRRRPAGACEIRAARMAGLGL